MRAVLPQIILAGLLLIPPAFAADSFNQLLKDHQAVNESINKLTLDDVPAALRTRVEQSEANGLITKTFFRGDKKTLTVSWPSDPKTRESQFVANVHHNGERIATIAGLEDAETVNLVRKELSAILMVSIRKNKNSRIVFNDGKSMEIIEIDGRATRLVDDVEYFRTITTLGLLTDAIKSDLEAGKEKPKP